MKKTKILLLICSLFIFSINLSAKEVLKGADGNELKVKEFNYSEEIDYNGDVDSYWDEASKKHVYSIPMINSKDMLLAYKDESSFELTPVIFLNLESENAIYKDINNRKVVMNLELTESGKVANFEYFKENDSQEGFALAGDGCIGGSTTNCMRIAIAACQQDWQCQILCRLSGWRCHGAIIIACIATCNEQ